MNLDQYLLLCENFRKAPSDELFQSIVAGADVLPRSRSELAREFEVAESTVSRWAKGYARPHRLVQQRVVSHLGTEADREIKLRLATVE